MRRLELLRAIVVLLTLLPLRAVAGGSMLPADCTAMGGSLMEYPAIGNEPPRAVVLVVHGFNLKPAKLGDLIKLMTSRGAYVVRLTLTGHNDDFAAMEHVTRDGWLHDMSCATRYSSALGQSLKCPLDFVGVSLGALLNADFVNESSDHYYSKRLYLVPAIRLNWYTKWLKALNILPFAVNVPSFAPEAYRVHRHLPMAAYNAVFASAAHIEVLAQANLAMPTLIYASPCDELVDYSAIEYIIKKHPDSAWRLKRIDNDASDISPHYCHNAVDSVSMGAAEWLQFSVGLIDFLGLVPDVDDQEDALDQSEERK